MRQTTTTQQRDNGRALATGGAAAGHRRFSLLGVDGGWARRARLGRKEAQAVGCGLGWVDRPNIDLTRV